jgi:hypothetical protein
MTSLAEAFGLGRGCFGREGVLRCTGTFPETGGSGRPIFLIDRYNSTAACPLEGVVGCQWT